MFKQTWSLVKDYGHGQTNMVEAIDKQTWSSLRQSALMRALAALDHGAQALSGVFCCKTNGDGTFVMNNELHHYDLL